MLKIVFVHNTTANRPIRMIVHVSKQKLATEPTRTCTV